MNQPQKDSLLHEAKSHLVQTTNTISAAVERLNQELSGTDVAYRDIAAADSETAFEDEMRARAAGANTAVLRDQMAHLAQSPYFARVDLDFADEPLRPYYIGKYSASELGIYSWTSAVAALRFEAPGSVGYQPPVGTWRTGRLERRDQYMIARGHMNFMTTEGVGYDRELVYQEHFSGRKTGFVLPEVVAQMEKAQDQVVRAAHKGPFVISGPAGSGKTTLALHRVAYLRQAPETTELYPAESILVLVQDNDTEAYFSHLLPELGIHDVHITTFGHWAIRQLELGRYFYHARAGHTELERDRYEWAKLQALQAPLAAVTVGELRRPDAVLKAHYKDYLDDGQMGLLTSELEEGAVDRFDLTLLLRWREQAEGRLMKDYEHVTHMKAGRTRSVMRRVPVEYSLILVDEFQNYMPEQLRLLKGVTNKFESMLYIGDMAQQTAFGTLQDWSDIGETIEPERAIRLQKVYRNTRQILQYIQVQGYDVDIPDGVANGPAVVEHAAGDVAEALQYIVGLTRAPGAQLGIIAKDPATIETYADYFADDDSVRCMTMREAQGVEFEVVVLVGLDEVDRSLDAEDEVLAAEQQRINRDLLYVALTRAMAELHVLKKPLPM
jgi:DNA helicase IV